MPTIVLKTHITAPAEVCFDLIRNPRIHTKISSQTNDRSSAGILNSEFGLGQSVVFEQKFFGIRQKLTVEVVEYDRPNRFVDETLNGWFRSFKHIHEFAELDGKTVVCDTLIWKSPFGFLGRIVDTLLLKRHLRSLVKGRNVKLKMIAENSAD